MSASADKTQALIDAHKDEIERAVSDKESVIAYLTTENGKAFLNVLDFQGDGGDFHRFPINLEACMRLACESTAVAYLGTAHPRSW